MPIYYGTTSNFFLVCNIIVWPAQQLYLIKVYIMFFLYIFFSKFFENNTKVCVKLIYLGNGDSQTVSTLTAEFLTSDIPNSKYSILSNLNTS